MLTALTQNGTRKKVLDPDERIAEVLFGLIMVLTFTGALSVAEAGAADVRIMLIGALGCNLAWGIIDAIFYLMGSFAEKGHGLKILKLVRGAKDPKEAQQLIEDALPAVIGSLLEPEEYQHLHQRLKDLPDQPERAHLDKDDWLGALGVFLLVFLSTFPIVIPFVFLDDIKVAKRTSNMIAVVMLFGLGFAYGKYAGNRPWLVAVSMLILGLIIVAMTIALGG